MKTGIVLFSVLLLFWIAGSSYVYVCKVRKDCRVEQTTPDSLILPGMADTLQAPVPGEPVPAMHTLYFDFNRSTCVMDNESNTYVELIKHYIAGHPDKKIRVTGHSDSVGSPEGKMKVSSSRAEFVKQELLKAGIDLKSIETRIESDNQPVSDNSTPESRAKNRRVEIQIQ